MLEKYANWMRMQRQTIEEPEETAFTLLPKLKDDPYYSGSKDWESSDESECTDCEESTADNGHEATEVRSYFL